jgi:CelD/BcsL family acetyltransferase involved in cellulose biosynthesis
VDATAPAARHGGTGVKVADLSLDAVADDAALATAWNDLALRVPDACYFQSADWVLAWWETVAHHAPARVALWRDDGGTLRAVAAVALDRERVHRRAPITLRVARIAGSGPGAGDHCAPLIDPATPQLVSSVAAWMEAAAGGRTLVLDAAGERFFGSRAHRVERVECPRLDLVELPERLGRSRNFRAQLGRFARRLDAAGVVCTWRAPGAFDASIVDALFDLHHRNRDDRGQRTSLDHALHALCRASAARAAEHHGPAGVVATKGDEIVGVLFGFQWGDWFGAYQSGWDPAYAPLSIGSVLVANAIREAAAHGARTFDFLRGAEQYKYRFGADATYDDVCVVPRGVSGGALLARAALKRWQSRSRRGERD